MGEEVGVRCCPDARFSGGGDRLKGGDRGLCSEGCFGGGV
jgi:hypothetical protein